MKHLDEEWRDLKAGLNRETAMKAIKRWRAEPGSPAWFIRIAKRRIENVAFKIQWYKTMWENYIRTEKGAQEAVELMFALFVFCAIDGLWATYNLLNMLLSAIW